jgi:hypothetical protein
VSPSRENSYQGSKGNQGNCQGHASTLGERREQHRQDQGGQRKAAFSVGDYVLDQKHHDAQYRGKCQQVGVTHDALNAFAFKQVAL